MDKKRELYFAQLRTRLEQDFRLLRAAITAAEPAAKVPSCPDWNADQLAHHVAQTYLHKVRCIREGAFPEDWPPTDLDPSPVGVLDEGYAALAAEFDAHRPADPAATWHDADQTVGFWIRRMCQETVVHRVDGELVAGLELAPIPEEIALDGIDEFLSLFIGYLSTDWNEHFAEVLEHADPSPVVVVSAGRSWTLTAKSAGVEVTQGAAPTGNPLLESAAASITGSPRDLLLWLWGRLDDRVVQRQGDKALLEQFAALRRKATR